MSLRSVMACRTGVLLLGSAMAVAILATSTPAPASAAAPQACRVTNMSTGAKYTRLKAAVVAARSGQKLRVKGVCHGRAVIGKNLTIKGVRTRTSGRATIDGEGRIAVLRVRQGATVNVRAVTIRGGSRWGYGISNSGSLTINGVTVRGNKGGGVYNDGDLSMRGNTIIAANNDGGVYNEGALSLYDTTAIRGNKAKYGGGVDNRGALWLFDSSAISGNTANEGGGVQTYDGIITLAGSSSIHSNVAYTKGGGVYGDGGSTMVLKGAASIRSNNAYADGGGAWFYGTITMTDAATIHGNSAESGGGLSAFSPYDLTGVACGTNVYNNTPEDCRFELP